MFGAYQRWCRTTSTRAQYYENMLEMCGLLDDPECPKVGRHREMERAEIKKSEEEVTRTIAAIESFTNPFNVADKDHLYSLASGAPVPPEAELDVLQAEQIGKEAKKKLVKERFESGSSEALFFEPIKRQRLKTMEASSKVVKLTASEGKVVFHSKLFYSSSHSTNDLVIDLLSLGLRFSHFGSRGIPMSISAFLFQLRTEGFMNMEASQTTKDY